MDTQLPDQTSALPYLDTLSPDCLVPLASSPNAATSHTPRVHIPYQLSFLSPLPCVDMDERAEPPKRKPIPRQLRESDVIYGHNPNAPREPLRTQSGGYLPMLYTNENVQLSLADPNVIIASAEALLDARFRRGARILKDPKLLLKFLKLRLVSQPRAVFAAFFLDRNQRLIYFRELFRDTVDHVTIPIREVVRETLDCNAEQILCVRSDPTGISEPMQLDISVARRLREMLDTIELPLIDYIVVGDTVTSLRQRRVI
jgi:DNA repair protein RadC